MTSKFCYLCAFYSFEPMMDNKNLGTCSSNEELLNMELSIVSSGSWSFLEEDLAKQQADCKPLYQLTDSLMNGRLDQVLQSDIVRTIISVEDIDTSLKETKLGVIIERLVQQYLDGSDDGKTLRQRCVFLLGIASLQLFIQNNWIGPANSLCLLHCMSADSSQASVDKDKIQQVQACALSELSIHDSTIYPLVSTPEFLLLAKCILVDCLQDTTSCMTGNWWALRCLWVWQQVLDERAPPIYNQIIQLIQKVSDNDVLMCKETHPDLCMTFHLECSHILQYYYDYKPSQEHVQSAEKIAGLKITLTGALGKRTKFQSSNLAQLLLKVEKEPGLGESTQTVGNTRQPVKGLPKVGLEKEPGLGESTQTVDDTRQPVRGLPKDLALDDDTLLDAIKLQDPEEGHIPALSAVEQAIVLALGIQRKRNSPKHELLGEEILAYVTTALKEPQTWCVHMAALMLRCQLEKDRRRTVERAMMQMQSLVDQWRDEACPVNDRLKLFFATNLPPKWAMEKLLAGLFLSLGSTSAALEVYLRLHLWEDAVSCYKRLDKLDKAKRLIREQLALKETPLMLCLLGDVTQDAEHYEKAWEVSGQRSARAMRSLGLLCVHNKEYERAIDCLEKSLEKNFLQYHAWFLLGYAAIQAEKYATASRAYHKCVNLEPDNAEAWNNLSTALIRLKDKQKAFRTLQEAIKCNYENWKIWENYLLTSTDIGEFSESIKAYNRLMELQDKYVDEEVLGILVKSVCSQQTSDNVTDVQGMPAEDFRKKMVELFGHLTSKVTNNAQVWSLYAQLHGNGQSDDVQANDKALQCLQKGHRLKSQSADWVKDVKTCREIMEQSLELAQAYIKCSSSKSNAGEAIQLLSSAKLMLKSIFSKVKQQQSDSAVYTSAWSELAEPLDHIENTLITITQQITQRKGQS